MHGILFKHNVNQADNSNQSDNTAIAVNFFVEYRVFSPLDKVKPMVEGCTTYKLIFCNRIYF